MLILPIKWDEEGKPTLYQADAFSNGKFIGRFTNPTPLLVIKNAVLRAEIMQLCSKMSMVKSVDVPVRCEC